MGLKSKATQLVTLIMLLAACEPTPDFTPAEKEVFFRQCADHDGLPEISLRTKYNTTTLECLWQIPSQDILPGALRNKQFRFRAYEVNETGIWIRAYGSDRLPLFLQACKNRQGSITQLDELYEYCLIDGAYYEQLDVVYAFSQTR